MLLVRTVAAAVLAVPLLLAPAAEADDDLVGWVTTDFSRAFPDGAFVNGTFTLPGPVPGPEGGDVTRESTLGNLTADAHRSAPPGDTSWSGPRIGVSTPRALAADLLFDVPDPQWPPPSGFPDQSRITRDELEAAVPEPEPLWRTTVTGAQLRALLEQQWRTDAYDGRPDLHLGLSGNVRYAYDPTRPRGERVLSVHVDDEPVDLAAGYRLTLPESLLSGPDAFPALADGTATVALGTTDRDALAQALGLVAGWDLEERAVGVSGLPDRIAPESALTFHVSGLNLLSIGAYRNDTLTVSLSGTRVVESLPLPAEDLEAATVTVEVPPGVREGAGTLLLQTLWGTRVEVPVTVGPGRAATRLTVEGDGGTHVYGSLAPTGLRVQVGPAGVEGVVDVLDGDRVVASRTLVDGRAEYRLTPTTPAGRYDLTVRYRGDERHAPSQAGPVTLTVRPDVSATTLTTRRPASWLPVVWSSDVRVGTGAQPVGYVELREGTRVLSRTRVVRGLALGTVPSLGAGAHHVVAVFVPDEPGNVTGSRSRTVTLRG